MQPKRWRDMEREMRDLSAILRNSTNAVVHYGVKNGVNDTLDDTLFSEIYRGVALPVGNGVYAAVRGVDSVADNIEILELVKLLL